MWRKLVAGRPTRLNAVAITIRGYSNTIGQVPGSGTPPSSEDREGRASTWRRFVFEGP